MHAYVVRVCRIIFILYALDCVIQKEKGIDSRIIQVSV